MLKQKTFLILVLLTTLLLLTNTVIASEDRMHEPEWDENQEAYLISNITELNWIRNDLQADYKLIDDIDASETQNWNNGSGFEEIGDSEFSFVGDLDGQNFKIVNLTLEDSIFGFQNDDSIIKNLKLRNVNSTGTSGVLIDTAEGRIENVEIIGIESKTITAGLVGRLSGFGVEGVMKDSYAEFNISNREDFGFGSDKDLGGLIRRLDSARLEKSQAEVNFQLKDDEINNIGGLAAYTRNNAHISHSSATVNISGGNQIGGLVGDFRRGGMSQSSAEGTINGEKNVGGLTGRLGSTSSSSIQDSYSDVDVSGDIAVGGLVGYNDDGGQIENTYSKGEVEGNQEVGGLIGWNTGHIDESFWDLEKSGLEDSSEGEGKTTEKIKSFYSYSISKDLGTGRFQYPSIDLEESEAKTIDLKGENYDFELVELIEDEESQLVNYEEAEIRVNEETYTLENNEEFEVENINIQVSLSTWSEEVTLSFEVEESWDIGDVASFSDSNQSYTWNIIDGESYPFLSWEELEEGNNTLTLEIIDGDSDPVEDATVQIDSFVEETDSDGEAVFENLHETSYTAIADKEGYHENSISFQITEEEQTETLTLEEKSSTFEITELDLTPENVEEGETVQANTTINNTGSEKGKRSLELKTNNELIGEETIELEEGQDEVISFEFSKQQEGEHGITAEIFEDNKTETLTVGPELFNLEIKKTPETAGNTTPETGNYTYEGEAVTVEAEPDLGWSFKEWNGVNKETKEITLTMDEDKQIEAVFEEDIDIEIGEVAVPKTENGELEFNYQIANQNENITENLTIEFNDREINQTEKTVSEGETLESENNNFDLISGDASENAELELEYAGVSDTRSFEIAAIEKDIIEGWNYFSLPIATSEVEPVDEILDKDKIESVWTYRDGEWKNYHPEAPENHFEGFRGGQGYIVEAEEDFTVRTVVNTNLSAAETDITGAKPAEKQLSTGYNLIGSYWNREIEASEQKAFDSIPQGYINAIYGSEADGTLSLTEKTFSDYILPGNSYWVFSKQQEDAVYAKTSESK